MENGQRRFCDLLMISYGVFEFDKLDNERIVNQIEQVKRREK